MVDTSIWIDFLRGVCEQLKSLLETNSVMTHPSVIGELACGNLHNRQEILSLLDRLPKAKCATDSEVLGFIESHKLMGLGIGYIDSQLLASSRLSENTQLWTRDKRLAEAARDLSLFHNGH